MGSRLRRTVAAVRIQQWFQQLRAVGAVDELRIEREKMRRCDQAARLLQRNWRASCDRSATRAWFQGIVDTVHLITQQAVQNSISLSMATISTVETVITEGLELAVAARKK